jgi:hypothetical protein
MSGDVRRTASGTKEDDMTPQQRIDASILRVFGRDGSPIPFKAADLGPGTIVAQNSLLSVRISSKWVETVEDDMLDQVLRSEGLHRAAHSREAYNIATDAVIDHVIQDRYLVVTPADAAVILDDVDTDGMGTHVRITKGDLDLYFGYPKDQVAMLGTTSGAELLADLVRRLEAEGYEVGEPVTLDLSGSMEGQYDGDAIGRELDSIFVDRGFGSGNRRSRGVVLMQESIPQKLAARALMDAGSPVAERFSRQDENDRWNRSQGRRGNGRGGRRGR